MRGAGAMKRYLRDSMQRYLRDSMQRWIRAATRGSPGTATARAPP